MLPLPRVRRPAMSTRWSAASVVGEFAVSGELRAMNLLRAAAGLALLFGTAALRPDSACAQEISFDQINKFESLGTGTLHVGAPPKTIIDDGERHIVVLTIWDADAETKVYWRSPDGNDPRTTIIPGKGIQTFQTAGEFKLEAVGEPNREVNYGYVLLGLKH